MAELDALAAVEKWIGEALTAMEPAARKTLLRGIARTLRRRNQARQARQAGPDGAPWPARKRSSHGKVRKAAKMMVGLRQARRLLLSAGADGAEVGYSGRSARIASVHHFGWVDAVEPGGPRVKYPARPLIGLPPEDVAFVRRAVLAGLEGKQVSG